MNLFRSRNTQEIKPSPELQLLLSCARTRLDEATTAQIRELAGGEIDWPGLRALAHRHRVMPLLYRSLYKTCPELAPEDALGQLRQDYQTNAARNMLLKQELLKILHMLDANGIPAIPFKGPTLAEQAYGELALRQFDDLDILIQECDILKARDIMVSQGYQPEYDVMVAAGDHYLRYEGEYNFMGSESRIGVEIHWHLVPRSFIRGSSFEQMIFEPPPDSQGLQSSSSLSSEDMLLVLCMHGARHAWTRIGWLCDLSELLSRMGGISWDELLERAQEINCQRMLFLGLWLTKERLGVELPQGMCQSIESDPAIISLAEDVASTFLSVDHREPTPTEITLFQLRIRRRLTDRIWYLAHLLGAPSLNDWTVCRVPLRLSFIYPFLRPIRLAINYIFCPLYRGLLPRVTKVLIGRGA